MGGGPYNRFKRGLGLRAGAKRKTSVGTAVRQTPYSWQYGDQPTLNMNNPYNMYASVGPGIYITKPRNQQVFPFSGKNLPSGGTPLSPLKNARAGKKGLAKKRAYNLKFV